MEKRVAALYVYPVKSCRGLQLDAAAICPTGFRWDRQWLIVNERGRMLSQRVEPKLAMVEPFLPPEHFTLPLASLPADTSLCLKAPGMQPLQIPLFGSQAKDKVNVSVWDWSGVALDEGPAAEAWFSNYLGRTCHLVRYDPAVTERLTDSNYADGYKAAFSDGFPFLIASQASLDALNSRLEHSIPINRFRPNILVEGSEAFEDDSWRTFSVGRLTFHGVKICARCKITTINQDTGEAGDEPTVALQTFRKGEMLSTVRSARNLVYFGQNAVCEEFMKDDHIVRVGDPIQVHEIFKELSV